MHVGFMDVGMGGVSDTHRNTRTPTIYRSRKRAPSPPPLSYSRMASAEEADSEDNSRNVGTSDDDIDGVMGTTTKKITLQREPVLRYLRLEAKAPSY